MLVIPVIGITINLATERSYFVEAFPPMRCTGSLDVHGILIVPLNGLVTVGIFEFIIISWIVHKVRKHHFSGGVNKTFSGLMKNSLDN